MRFKKGKRALLKEADTKIFTWFPTYLWDTDEYCWLETVNQVSYFYPIYQKWFKISYCKNRSLAMVRKNRDYHIWVWSD